MPIIIPKVTGLVYKGSLELELGNLGTHMAVFSGPDPSAAFSRKGPLLPFSSPFFLFQVDATSSRQEVGKNRWPRRGRGDRLGPPPCGGQADQAK
jgi:hypothetical protein